MVKVNETVSDSPLFTLASVSVELLKATALETTSSFAQGKGSEKRIPSIDLETPPRELSSCQEFRQPTEPSTPHQPTVDQPTQELAWSVS